MEFDWIKTFDEDLEQRSVFYKDTGVSFPENMEEVKKYAILNIIDQHFDTVGKPTPYDLDNNESGSLNSFFVNAWDFLGNYLSEPSEKNKKRLLCYYLSSIDCENFIYAISRYKPRKCVIKGRTDFEEKLTNLYNYYFSRNDFGYIDDIDKKPSFKNSSYKVKVYLINGDENVLVEQKDIGTYYEIYAQKNGEENYFEYIIENDFDIDSFGDVTNGISVFFELFDAIRKTCISYLGIDAKDADENSENFRSNFNYYEEYFKNYFYKILTEKYRTKNIEDQLLQELKYTDPGYGQVIEKLYAKMNGKNGNMGSPNLVTVSKETKFNGKFNSLKIPFYKSSFSDGGLISFYTEKRHLPASFNIIKNYDSLKDYYEKLFNGGAEQFSYEDVDREELLEYFEENKISILNNRIKELMYSVKPSFNFTFENFEIKSKYEEKKTLIYKNSIKNFQVKEFNSINAIEFGRESTGRKTRDYAKITIFNPYLKDLKNPESIDLGSGFLNIQQFRPIARDNLVTNFNSSLFEFDTIKAEFKANLVSGKIKYNEIKYDLNKFDDLKKVENIKIGYNNIDKISKHYIINTEEMEEIPEDVLQDGIGTDKENKISVHHKFEDFVTPLEDKEITISHLTKFGVGSTRDLEWTTGYYNNGYVDKVNVPEYKKTNIYTGDDGSYLLDVTNFSKYNNVESIRQIEVVDYKTGILYSFMADNIKEQTYLEEYSCLELDNDNLYPYIDSSVLYNYVTSKVEDHSLEIDSIESNSVKIKIPKGELKTFMNGEMLVLGEDIKSKLSNVLKDNDDYLLLSIELKNGTVVNRMKTFTKKSIVLKQTDEVKKFLDSLNIDEQRTVYISSFTQREGNADIYYVSDIRLMNNDFTGEEYTIDVDITMWGAEVNINYTEEINIEEK